MNSLVESSAEPLAAPRGASGAPRKTILWLSFLVLLAVVVGGAAYARRQGVDPAVWLGHVWQLIAAVPVQYVLVALVLKLTEVTLNAFAWKVTLQAAFPQRPVTFRQTFGVVQGGVGILSIIPPKFGGFPVLGLYKAVWPDLPLATLLASRGVQGVASWVLGSVLLLAFGAIAAEAGVQGGLLDQVGVFVRERPIPAILIAVALIALVVWLVVQGRAARSGVAQQFLHAGAILATPHRYVLLVAVPTMLSFALRWGVTGTLMTAFGLPVTFETLLRVNFSHGIARSLQVTPGGLGTTQAFDLVALNGFASPELITAYSLSQSAILLVFNVLCGVLAVLWSLGWEKTVGLFRASDAAEAPTPQAAPSITAR